MNYFLITLTAFFASILTFFSGFGLGTLLSPVFMLFFPVEISIALTGVVHFLNNLFKLTLVGRFANKEVLVRFGIPAILFAFIGSYLLWHLSQLPPLFQYTFYGNERYISPIKFVIALLLIVFSLLELSPRFQQLQFDKSKLAIGGALSGFFGGLSGNQGALRSAFLVKVGLSKEAFIATGVAIATFIDITRLSVYASQLSVSILSENQYLLLSATIAAFLGAFLGNKLLKKVTLRFLQLTVAVFLLLMAVALGTGIL